MILNGLNLDDKCSLTRFIGIIDVDHYTFDFL